MLVGYRVSRSILQVDGIPKITFNKQYLHWLLHRGHLLHLSSTKPLWEGFGKKNYITPVTEALRKYHKTHFQSNVLVNFSQEMLPAECKHYLELALTKNIHK